MKNYPKDCIKWLVPKAYRHFDSPIKTYYFETVKNSKSKDEEKCISNDKSIEKVKKIVADPEQVAKHSFYPFMGFDMNERKFSKSKALLYEIRNLKKTLSETTDLTEKANIEKELASLNKEFKHKLNKDRPIRYASHVDGHIYAYYSKEILLPKYEAKLTEAGLENEVLAYREVPYDGHIRSSNITMAKEIFENIISRKNQCIALAYDIKSFYDNIDHENLKKSWCDILGVERLPADHFNIYKSLTNYCFVNLKAICSHFIRDKYCFNRFGEKFDCSTCREPKTYRLPKVLFKKASEFRKFRESVSKDSFQTNEGAKAPKPFGIPQGSALSSTLSNIYMLPFDIEVKKFVDERGGLYRRYCDDIMIICHHDYKNEIDKFIRDKIEERGENLKIHEILEENPHSKSQVYDFQSPNIKKRPLQYLGFCFDGENVRIRESSLSRYMRKAHRGVVAARFNAIKRMRELKARGVDVSNEKYKKLFRRTLYERYSLVGKNNFIYYVDRAFSGTVGLNNKSIRSQIKGHFSKLKKDIDLNDLKVLEVYDELNKK